MVNMVHFFPVHRSQVDKGNFPLTHDCVLKIRYFRGPSTRNAYYTTRSIDTGILCDVIAKLPMVQAVEVVPVDLLTEEF